jgi:hypothetical protein
MKQEDKNIQNAYSVITEGSNSHGYNQGKGPDGKDAPHWKEYRKKLKKSNPDLDRMRAKAKELWKKEENAKDSKGKKKKEGVEETDNYQDRAFAAGQKFKGPMFSTDPEEDNYDEVTKLIDELIYAELSHGSGSLEEGIPKLIKMLQAKLPAGSGRVRAGS